VQEINVVRLDAFMCKDDVAASPPLATAAAAVFVFVRFAAAVAAGNCFVAGGNGTLTDDDDADDDCTARPLHLRACSLDIYHNKQTFTVDCITLCLSSTRQTTPTWHATSTTSRSPV